MKKLLLLLIIILSSFVNAQPKISNTNTSIPIVIINSFDASSLQVRKNKKELFKELADSLQVYLSENIKRELGIESVIIPGPMAITDSAAHSLMVTNHSTKAIVIRSLEVYFNEGAEKHKEEYGMSPRIETSYDLCSKIDYSFYSLDSTSKESQINHCDYFTTRSVNDKAFVIKFGPDIVGKKRHTYGAIERNAIEYIQSLTSYFEKPLNQ